MNFKSYQDLSHDIRKNLPRLHQERCDLVVGIPRSGMIPAHIIASLLNVNCTDSVSFVNNMPLKHGQRRSVSGGGREIRLPSEARAILLVDDSIDTGESLACELPLIREAACGKVRTLAVYSSFPSRNDVDIVLEYLPMPRAFEWNLFHHSVMGKACVDIDGVLCVDPSEDENDDGPRYLEFLATAEPLIIPTRSIFALVTSRLERYRKETEAWLRKQGIVWDNLIMLDLPSKEERIRGDAHAKHKADYYKRCSARLFVESRDRQAREISALSRKAVYSVESGALFVEGKRSDSVYHRKYCLDGRAYSVEGLIMHRLRWALHISGRRAVTTLAGLARGKVRNRRDS